MFPQPIVSIAGTPVLTLYDLCLALGVLAAVLLADRLAIGRGFSVRLQKTMLYAAVGAVVLGYGSAVLFQAFYNFLAGDKFVLNADTGATFYGGLIGGAAVFLLLWFALGKGEAKEKFPDIADIAAVCIPLAHAIGRLGCLAAGCCHGKATDGAFGVFMEAAGEKVVPVQLYESLFLFALFGVSAFFFRKKTRFPLLPVYCVFYGVWRFFIEYARGDERGASLVAFLSPSQLTALLLVAVGIGYYLVVRRNRNKK